MVSIQLYIHTTHINQKVQKKNSAYMPAYQTAGAPKT